MISPKEIHRSPAEIPAGDPGKLRTFSSILHLHTVFGTVNSKTSSRNVMLRYLLTIISFLLKNIWVALQWIFFSKVQRGPRTIDDDLFRFDLFRLLIWEGIRKKLKCISFVSVLRSTVDRRLTGVVDYPRFMEENSEKYWDYRLRGTPVFSYL